MDTSSRLAVKPTRTPHTAWGGTIVLRVRMAPSHRPIWPPLYHAPESEHSTYLERMVAATRSALSALRTPKTMRMPSPASCPATSSPIPEVAPAGQAGKDSFQLETRKTWSH